MAPPGCRLPKTGGEPSTGNATCESAAIRFIAMEQEKSQVSLESLLPPTAWEQLHAFVMGANREALNEHDWHLYYEFVKSCHIFKADVDIEVLVRFLGERGFSEEPTIELGLVYVHGRALLASRGPENPVRPPVLKWPR